MNNKSEINPRLSETESHSPMRARRRQSDAKWRASVATCYDALRHAVPETKCLSKKKVSKVKYRNFLRLDMELQSIDLITPASSHDLDLFSGRFSVLLLIVGIVSS